MWIASAIRKAAGTDVKHFAANSQEKDRLGVNERVSERALREIYFPEELVVNASRENLITVLKEHQKPVADLLEGSKEE